MHFFTCTLNESTTGVHFHFWLLCLFEAFPVNNYSAMSAKWRLTVNPILGYQGEKGGGGKCPPIVFLEGANIHHYTFVEGAIILPCQLFGGQMSTHAIFHRGADVGGGGGRKCPAPVSPSPKKGHGKVSRKRAL